MLKGYYCIEFLESEAFAQFFVKVRRGKSGHRRVRFLLKKGAFEVEATNDG